MPEITVQFTTNLPVFATQEQRREWIEYELGARGGCSMDNPLVDYELEAERVTIRS